MRHGIKHAPRSKRCPGLSDDGRRFGLAIPALAFADLFGLSEKHRFFVGNAPDPSPTNSGQRATCGIRCPTATWALSIAFHPLMGTSAAPLSFEDSPVVAAASSLTARTMER